jgi:UDP-GlcNAc:undecaprenyl-phosphate/decaprenyl-phosphate GlcNAc-1-phosphate transferase
MTALTFRLIFLSLSFSLVFGQAAYYLSAKVGLLDRPNSRPHKVHGTPIPIAGGIAIFLTVVAGGLISQVIGMASVWPAVAAGSVVFLFGLIDDFKNLPPVIKLFGQVAAGILLVLFGIQVRLFDPAWINWLITLVWVVGMTNAFNFVDSMDGLACGLGALAAAFFMLVTFDAGQLGLSLFSAIVLGAVLGSFYYNAQPARYFLGDSGAQLVGFILAAVAIEYAPVGFIRLQSWYVPILLLAVPIFDTALVIISRWRRGRPVYMAGRDHTYHRLVSIGMSSNRAVLTMHLIALLLGCMAFVMLPMPPLFGNGLFAGFVLVGLFAIIVLDRKAWWK